MAIQIDLLPQYVGLRRKVKVAAVVMVVIYIIAGTVFTLVWYSKTLEVQTAKQNVAIYQPIATETTDTKSKADAKVASLAPMETTVKFFSDASQTGPRRAAVINMMKPYIVGNALVSAIDIPDGKSVLITAAVKNTDDYGNLLLNLRKGFIQHDPLPSQPTVFDSLPKASGVRGFPLKPEQPAPLLSFGDLAPQTFPIDVNISTSLKPDLIFETPLALGETAAPAAPGQPGSAPGSGSGSGSGSSSGSSSPPTT